MEIFLGYLSAVLIGLSLGLTGGGGSILTVPLLVYVIGINPILATAYSLFVVGVSAGVGAISAIKKGMLEFKSAFTFAVPSMISVFITRKFIVPAIPSQLLEMGGFVLTKEVAVMILFAVLMILAAFSMIRAGGEGYQQKVTHTHPFMLVIVGLVVGFIAGIVGAGGGFLIIPALVLLAGIPMKSAVGTSLLIISSQSLIGFLGDVTERVIDWMFLLQFSLIAVAGIFIGMAIAKKISNKHLKAIFGWFVLCMGVYIILAEVFFEI